MRIMPAGSAATVQSLRRTPPPNSGFADLVDADLVDSGRAEPGLAEPDQPGAAGSTCPTTTASPLTARSPPDREARDPGARDRQARRQGNALVHALSGLQAAVLLGAPTGDARQQLARMASLSTDADDPALQAALRAIAVRVAVELAKGA